MTLYRITRAINCTDSGVCHETIQARIEASIGLKLHSEADGDKVDGYIYIQHKQGNHLIVVDIYDSLDHEYVSGHELRHFAETGIVVEEPLKRERSPPPLRKITKATPTKRNIKDAIDGN